ncbi:chromosome partitioning protein ParB [Sphingomonas sp. C8-2]|nr:chromosome partitioning protein ParB [Sphingomonas sp. C8-2]
MKLAFFDHDALFVDMANMRHGRKSPDVSDIIATVRKRGVLVPLVVRAPDDAGRAGIVAGARRWTANGLVRAEGIDHGPLPCAIIDDGDDAAAIEASLIENVARRDPDEVTQWQTFTRLVREGRRLEEISDTFGLPDLAVRRILALGQLLPRLRSLYAREMIDAATIRHLTMASKRQQQDWLALYDDPDQRTPTGHQLKAWLFGGQSINAAHALFDVVGSGLATVSDLFGDNSYFAEPDTFWTAQYAAIEARKADYLAAGWADVVILGPADFFYAYEHEKTPKRQGGKVFVDVRSSGEVTFHEGYLSRAEARKQARGEAGESEAKPPRPELTSTLATYVDLHRHAAVRAALCAEPGVALRLVAAHILEGSSLWQVRPEPQATRNDAIRESIACSWGEAVYAERRAAALALIGRGEDEPFVRPYGIGDGLAALFLRLLDLSDDDVLSLVAAAMAASLAAGSDVVEALGLRLGIDMADYWEANDGFFDLVRDKAVMVEIMREIAGPKIADANAKETGKTLKRIASDHLAGVDGRTKVERWVPRWMRFAPSAYSERGGVPTVAAHERVEAARTALAESVAGDEAPPDSAEAVVAEAVVAEPLAA